MKYLLLFIFFLSELLSYSQSSCLNPTHVNLCPSTFLPNQTNAGMGDDNPTCNLAGEDVTYEISAPHGANHIYVTISNSTGPMKLFIRNGNCSSGCSSTNVPIGTHSYTYYTGINTIYYLIVDAATTITYNLEIGGDTASHFVNIPNTSGNWTFDACAPQPFALIKPYFEVLYNGTYKTLPLTFSPLNTQGSLCVNVYLKNQTGVAGAKKFEFTFDTSITVVSPGANSFPGFYNAGTWNVTTIGTKLVYSFTDSAGIGKGDFDGTPNTCLKYSFCFNIIPTSNSPASTNIHANIFNDGFGTGYFGWVYQGCCPASANCYGAPGGASGSSGLSFGFNDPGNPLPISLLSFNANVVDKQVELSWETASEINNDHFTIERSTDGEQWEYIMNVAGSGNTTIRKTYSAFDLRPHKGISYYRLKQTDYDGTTTTFDPKKIHFEGTRIYTYPNPVRDHFTVQFPDETISSDHTSYNLEIYNLLGEKIEMLYNHTHDMKEVELDFSHLKEGYYLLQISTESEIVYREMVVKM